MERDQDEPTLSTADLADPTSEAAERSREPDLDRHEATDGRYDELETDSGVNASREYAAAERTGDDARSSAIEGSGTATDTDATSPLFEQGDVRHFESKWEAVQTGFVDEPRHAVERADTLVAELMQRLAEGFAHERSQLEAQWDRGDDVSTEDLRLALQRYRSFFGRLLQA